MRTNIDIDDKLMKSAMKASGLATKKAAVEEGLRLLKRVNEQKKITRWFGKVQFWDGFDAKDEKDKWAEADRIWEEKQKAKAADRPRKANAA